MILTNQQRIERLRRRLEELELWTVQAALPIDRWTFNKEPLAHGVAWPTREGVVTLAFDMVEVPADWPLEESRLDLDLGGEGLVRISYANGDADGFGLDPNHQRFPLRDRRFSVTADCVARLPFGVPNRAANLARARLIRIDPALSELLLLLTQVGETAEVLAGHEVVPPLLAAAEEALTKLDWPTATLPYVARVAPGWQMQRVWQLPADLALDPPALPEKTSDAALAFLKDRLRGLRDRYPQTGSLAMTGHAHIDLAWLWPLDETRRKANRTFSTMVGLMERYPEFRFNQSTAQLYAFLEEDDPALFARIKEKVVSGQWEPNGAMWVEPDTNMPTGESFVRQLLYGQRYFERTFGKRHAVCWLPDCFGFSPALPQVLQQAGVVELLHYQGQLERDQHHPARPLLVGGPRWQSRARPHLQQPGRRLQCRDRPEGDRRDLEELPRQAPPRREPACLRLRRRRRRPDRGDARAHAPLRRLPRGACRCARSRSRTGTPACTTPSAATPTCRSGSARSTSSSTAAPSRAKGGTKYLHRRAERALITAETLSSMATLLGGAPRRLARGAVARAAAQRVPRYPARLEHPRGLRGRRVRARVGRRCRQGGDRRQARRSSPARSSTAGRPRRRPRRQPRPFAAPAPHRLRRPSARRPTSRGRQRARRPATRSPASRAVTVVDAAAVRRASPSPTAASRMTSSASRSNDDGTLASVFDKRAGREALAGRGNQIWAYVDKPRSWDAWDIDESYARQGEEIPAASIEVTESGPHRAAIRRSSAASATARSFRPARSGPTRPDSTSRPTSTGTTAASCSRRASRWRSARTTRPSSARTA